MSTPLDAAHALDAHRATYWDTWSAAHPWGAVKADAGKVMDAWHAENRRLYEAALKAKAEQR